MRKVSKPKEPSGRTRALLDEERARLLEACRESKNPYLYAIVLLAMSTGMRRGEIMNLRWDQVNTARGIIKLLPEDVKNRTGRAEPLAGPALEEMRRLKGAKTRQLGRLVFPAPSSEASSEKPIDIQSAWKSALRRAEISDFRFHDLRHTAASYLLESGATLGQLAEILGHKTLQMVKRYTHIKDSRAAEIVERMNRERIGDVDAAVS